MYFVHGANVVFIIISDMIVQSKIKTFINDILSKHYLKYLYQAILITKMYDKSHRDRWQLIIKYGEIESQLL